MLSVTSLSNTNSTKIVELEEALASQLRDTIAGREEVEIAGFTEDEILALTSISLRARSLASMRNITSWLEEDEDGKQSSAWDIFNAITDRGQLGYREEETVCWCSKISPLNTDYKCFSADGTVSGSANSPRILEEAGNELFWQSPYGR